MKITESATIAAPRASVFPYIEDLAIYPKWLGLVTSVESVPPADDGNPAWMVELTAKIGPFARSKKLRMVRTTHDAPNQVAFERAELDGRDHAMWALRADLAETGEASSELTMHLAYDGDLWAGGGLIGKALNDQIKKGRSRLTGLIEADAS